MVKGTEHFDFDLLIARSLKHVKTGKCVHTKGAWPRVGRNMVLWSGCNIQRLELWFQKQGKSFYKELSKKGFHTFIAFALVCKSELKAG